MCLVFSALCWKAIDKKPRTYYDEERCATVDNDNKCKEPRENRFQQNKKNFFLNVRRQNNTNDESIRNITHDVHKLQINRISKTSTRLHESDSLSVVIHENDPIRDEYNKTNDETNLSIEEIMPTSVPQNSSLVRIK